MSLREEIDDVFIANTIRMVKIDGYYILVEGENDELLFSKFFNLDYSSIEICHGKEKLLSVIKILETENTLQKYLGIVDKDLEFLNTNNPTFDTLIETDYHDLEIMCFVSDAFKSFALEYFSKNKIKRFGDLAQLKNHIIELALQISKIRLLNFLKEYNLKLKPNKKKQETKELDYSKFICKKEFKYLGHDILLNTLSKYYNQGLPAEIKTLIKEIEELDTTKINALDLIHGHDLTNIISLGIKNCIGKSSLSNTKREDVERAIRLSYNYNDFKNSELFKKINAIDLNLLN